MLGPAVVEALPEILTGLVQLFRKLPSILLASEPYPGFGNRFLPNLEQPDNSSLEHQTSVPLTPCSVEFFRLGL